MAATAAHLVDRVLPEVPVRQWVLTLPFPLRLGCAFDRELQGSLRRIFVRAVTSGHARRARARGLPPGALGYRSGAVNVTQRAGGALNLNPHFHALFLDGVFTRESPLAPPRFHELAPPTPADVEWVLARIHARVERLLEQRAEEDSSDEERDQELLARLASASVQGRAVRAGALFKGECVTLREGRGQAVSRFRFPPTLKDVGKRKRETRAQSRAA